MLKNIKQWFINNKDWFNPMPEYSARIAKRDQTKSFPFPTLEDLYRAFTGCLYERPNSANNGRHLGIFDYLTFGIFYAMESFLRGHWKGPGPAQEKMQKYLIPLWGPLNIIRASGAIGVMAGLTGVFVCIAIPLMLLGGIGLSCWKLGVVIHDALQPWTTKWAKARETRRIAREEKRHTKSPEQAAIDAEKVRLRDLKGIKNFPRQAGRTSSTWVITKTITHEDGVKKVSYRHDPGSAGQKIRIKKRVYEGTRKELLKIREDLETNGAQLTFIEKKPRIGAPNRLVVRRDRENTPRNGDMTTQYIYIPRA